MTNPSNLDRILDRARKLSALAEHSGSEHEAALAASRLRKIMEDFNLTEAQLRIEDTTRAAEPILKDARLEPDLPTTNRKRVAWKECISSAVARDLGVHVFYRWTTSWTGSRYARSCDVRGVGRETAIQTWQYTCQYLWRQVDEMADKAWDTAPPGFQRGVSVRAWKNSFRLGCASKIAERITENRKAEKAAAQADRRAADPTPVPDIFDDAPPVPAGPVTALALIEKDQAEVDEAYEDVKRGFGRSAARIGSSSGGGYGAGREAGGRVSLGGKRVALPAGQGRLK